MPCPHKQVKILHNVIRLLNTPPQNSGKACALQSFPISIGGNDHFQHHKPFYRTKPKHKNNKVFFKMVLICRSCALNGYVWIIPINYIVSSLTKRNSCWEQGGSLCKLFWPCRCVSEKKYALMCIALGNL